MRLPPRQTVHTVFRQVLFLLPWTFPFGVERILHGIRSPAVTQRAAAERCSGRFAPLRLPDATKIVYTILRPIATILPRKFMPLNVSVD